MKRFSLALITLVLGAFEQRVLALASDCYVATPGGLSAELSVSLCQGSSTTAPVQCYSATPGGLSAELSVQLCAGAVSTAPVSCYNATPGELDSASSVALCAGAQSDDPVLCYQSTPGTLSSALSVKLCAVRALIPLTTSGNRLTSSFKSSGLSKSELGIQSKGD